MFEEDYVDDLVQDIKAEWSDSSTVHTIVTPRKVAPEHRLDLAIELQSRLQALYPDGIVTAREYGVGDIKVSKEVR